MSLACIPPRSPLGLLLFFPRGATLHRAATIQPLGRPTPTCPRIAPTRPFLFTPPHMPKQAAVPLERAGSCLMEVGNEIFGRDRLWEGFRTPVLTRFTT